MCISLSLFLSLSLSLSIYVYIHMYIHDQEAKLEVCEQQLLSFAAPVGLGANDGAKLVF